MRVNITLECTSCKERNYLTSKNKRNNPDRLEKQKYCPRERKDRCLFQCGHKIEMG